MKLVSFEVGTSFGPVRRIESIQINVAVEGDYAPDLIARIVREAEAGCFTINALRNPSPVTVSATLNDSSIQESAL